MANWVQKRAQRESILASKSSGVWDLIRAALQDAVESYNEHYSNPSKPEATCKLENGKRVLITRAFYSMEGGSPLEKSLKILVEFDEQRPCIKFVQESFSGEFGLSSDDREAFVHDRGERIEPDEVSRRMLEPIFFRREERKRPIFKVP